jgi:hypothetical protein
MMATDRSPTMLIPSTLNCPTYLKHMIDGVNSQPFSATTLPLEAPATSSAIDFMNELQSRYADK